MVAKWFSGKLVFFLITSLLTLIYATPASAETIKSAVLIENSRELDGQEIRYGGEAVGEILERGDYFWVNVIEGENAIGIWAEGRLKDKIQNIGDYKHEGDVLIIRGVFNRACIEHGGDMDIHAEDLELLYPGYEVRNEVDRNKLMLVFFLLSLILSLQQFERIQKKSKVDG